VSCKQYNNVIRVICSQLCTSTRITTISPTGHVIAITKQSKRLLATIIYGARRRRDHRVISALIPAIPIELVVR